VLELFHPLALKITVLLLSPGDLICMNSGFGSLSSAQHARKQRSPLIEPGSCHNLIDLVD
jgi:hypothetical protein